MTPRRRGVHSTAMASSHCSRCLFALLALLMAVPAQAQSGGGSDEDAFAARRAALVGTLRHAGRDGPLAERTRPISEATLSAIGAVPRHRFVDDSLQRQAHTNRPLPIGYGQTISQPFIVALMTDLLEVDGDDVVLEVGTGSGYQAAVLAELVKQVYTIEIVEPLATQATARLAQLGYDNITVRHGDGYYGWEAHAPFDAIVVTAAAPSIPPPLIEQLKPGGKMAIPVGAPFLTQRLVLVSKDADGKVRTRSVLPVRFVPLTGEH